MVDPVPTLSVHNLRKDTPWARWGKLAFVVVVGQGLLVHAAIGPAHSFPGQAVLLWVAALAYLSLVLWDRLQARLSDAVLLTAVNGLGALLPWLGGGLLATAILPAVGLNALLLRWPAFVALAALQAGGAIAAVLLFLPQGTAIPTAYVTGVAVVFVTAFARAVASEAQLRVALSEALSRLDAQQAQSEAFAVLAERERIAREVHDSLGHALVTAHLHVRLSERDLRERPEDALRALGLARGLLQTGLSELRATVRTLSTPSTDLSSTLRQLVEGYGTASLRTELAVRGTPAPLPTHAVLALYRVVQESLTNVVKHADARRVRVELTFESDATSLSIADDGRGASVDTREGFGVRGMRGRMAELGGSLELLSSADGHIVRARLPHG